MPMFAGSVCEAGSTMVGPYVYLLLFAAGLPRPALGDGGADDDAGAR